MYAREKEWFIIKGINWLHEHLDNNYDETLHIYRYIVNQYRNQNRDEEIESLLKGVMQDEKARKNTVLHRVSNI